MNINDIIKCFENNGYKCCINNNIQFYYNNINLCMLIQHYKFGPTLIPANLYINNNTIHYKYEEVPNISTNSIILNNIFNLDQINIFAQQQIITLKKLQIELKLNHIHNEFK